MTAAGRSGRLIHRVGVMLLFKTLIIVVQVLSALGVIGLVLLQHGKGADMGAAFGSGASAACWCNPANFLSRTTGILATIFFVATLADVPRFVQVDAVGGVLGGVATAPASAPAASAPAVAASAAAGSAASAPVGRPEIKS